MVVRGERDNHEKEKEEDEKIHQETTENPHIVKAQASILRYLLGLNLLYIDR